MWTIACVVFVSSVLLVESVPLTDNKDTLLSQHNDYRKNEGASNMNKLVWSSTLTSEADTWINGYTGCSMVHQSAGRGENLFWSYNQELTAAIDGMVDNWFAEKENYTYESNSCVTSQMCGHYKQVVWADTMYVGCAYKQCGPEFLGACFYHQAGNMGNEKPYAIGQPCTTCREGQGCEDSLCTGLVCVDKTEGCSMYCGIASNEPYNKLYCQKTCDFCPAPLS